MTTLSSALNYALSGLSVSSAKSALVSRNVSFASDENYTRRTADIISLPGGGAALSGISRSTDRSLLDKLMESRSISAGSDVTLAALNRIGATVGDPENDTSLPAILGKLQQALSSFESNPASSVLAAGALEASRDVVQKIRGISTELNDIRAQADASMQDSVDHINSLLSQFKVVNDAIVRGVGSASEHAETLDQRDSILKSLSEEIGIRTVTRSGNDVTIYAEGGTILFEGRPRSVKFVASTPLTIGSTGSAVQIDGVPVTGSSAVMPIVSGRLASQGKVRDELIPLMQTQLDAITSNLIRRFSESDQSMSPSLPDAAGLFVDGSSGAVPLAGEIAIGISSRLSLNPLADPQNGGDPMLIRDGGFGGAAYIYNTNGYPAFQGRIGELADSFDVVDPLDPDAALGTSGSLKSLSIEAAAGVEMRRQAAQASSDTAAAVHTRSSEALLRITGVNIDEEMAALLDLEKSYQASSKIISVVDNMLTNLLNAVR